MFVQQFSLDERHCMQSCTKIQQSRADFLKKVAGREEPATNSVFRFKREGGVNARDTRGISSPSITNNNDLHLALQEKFVFLFTKAG
jgi:hypothetical protein